MVVYLDMRQDSTMLSVLDDVVSLDLEYRLEPLCQVA